MKIQRNALGSLATLVVVLGAGAFLAGCPVTITPPPVGSQQDYDEGFDDGFAEDGEYWQGFYDSYDTVDGGPIYYTGSEIPYLDELSYEAGYWDGVWYAYNDGYFVDYDYAFTIGFSEGYDLAFSNTWPQFLAGDQHLEWLDGGFSDGYNDGFSEGRVFGAWDYDNGWPFDWLDALLDYREGTDLAIGGVSTGLNGPVMLYEYGTDPFDLVKSTQQRKPRRTASPAIRKGTEKSEKQDIPALSYRGLTNDVSEALNVTPNLSPRSDQQLQLGTSWLDRVNAYRNALGKDARKSVSRAAVN